MLALLLYALQEIHVDGLRVKGLKAGEAFQLLAPAEVPRSPHVDGRVVDAFTGRPVAGATVESWTEENDRVHGGFQRIGEAQSGVDGRFRVRSGQGAAKARVRAPGYLTLSTTMGDLHDAVELFPAQDAPVRLRIVDSARRPIEGARLTSTYSCAHDVPAFDVRTDAAGVALLPAYGLQADVPQLRLRAPGYAAVKYLDVARAFGARTEPWDVWMPRRPAQSLRVLDPQGEPLAQAPVVVFDDGDEQVLRTDGEGLAVLASRYGRGELMGQDVTQRIREPGYALAVGAESTLRLGGNRWPQETPIGRIQVRLVGDAAGAGEDPPSYQLLHADGWYESGRDLDEPVEFPAGEVSLVVGGDFEEYEREVATFELEPGRTQGLTVGLRRAPRITLVLPEGTLGSWIEAETESLVDPEPGEHFVPGGRRLRAFAHTAEGLHLLELPEAIDGLVVDLSADGSRVEAYPLPERATRHVVIAGDAESASGRLDLRSSSRAAELVSLDTPGHYRVEGPAGSAYFLRWSAQGHARTGFRGVLGEGQGTRTITPLGLARLEIESNVPFTPLTGDALDLEALHPGPLRLALETANGTLIGLDLELDPGERRTLTLRLPE